MRVLKSIFLSAALFGATLTDARQARALTRNDIAAIAERVYAASRRDFILKTGNRASGVRIVFVAGNTRYTMDFYHNTLTIWFRLQGTGTPRVSQYMNDVDMDGHVDEGAGKGVFDEGSTVYYSRREREYRRNPPQGLEYRAYWQARYERALNDLASALDSSPSNSDRHL